MRRDQLIEILVMGAGEDSPNAKKDVRKMGDKYTKPDFTSLLSLLSVLVCTQHVTGEAISPVQLDAEDLQV